MHVPHHVPHRGLQPPLMVACVLLSCWILTVLSTETTIPSQSSSSISKIDGGQKESDRLMVDHIESTISTVSINWTFIDHRHAVTRYQVQALSLSSGILLSSPVIVNQSKYTMPDLAVNTKYNVCVIVLENSPGTHRSDFPENSGSVAPVKACLETNTIPIVRLDSVYAFLIAAAFVGFLIGAAVVCWRCALRNYQSNEENGETSAEEEQTKSNPDQLPLLAESGKHHGKLDASASDQTFNTSPPPNDILGANKV